MKLFFFQWNIHFLFFIFLGEFPKSLSPVFVRLGTLMYSDAVIANIIVEISDFSIFMVNHKIVHFATREK